MDKEYSSKIIQNLDFIACNVISLPRLLNLLRQESVLSQVEVESIEFQQPRYKAGTQLANLICKKNNEVFPVFIRCLKQSGNEIIAQKLTSYPVTKGISEPILQNLDFIAEKVCCLTKLLNLLVQHSVISQVEVEAIKSHKLEYEAGTELANLISKKDSTKFQVFIMCLNESGNKVIAERLMTQSIGKDLVGPIWFGIPPPNRFYVGREKEMKILEEYWKECLAKKTHIIIAVTGSGGVGKSELAKNYAKMFYENAKGHCIWIKAENDHSLTTSFQNLAKNLEISLNDDLEAEKKFLEIVGDVYEKLFGGKVLFVFDNVENNEEVLKPVLKLLIDLSTKKSPALLKPFVLTTSRLRDARKHYGSQCNYLDLQILTKQSALQLFYTSLGVNQIPEDGTNELIEKLCERLELYPLALQQAAIEIYEKSSSGGTLKEAVTHYLTQIEKFSKAILDLKLDAYDELDSITKLSFLTWKITFENLRHFKDFGVLAKDIINIISFLDKDNIRTEMIKSILRSIGRFSYLANVDSFFDRIGKHPMITYANENTISVHPLIQEVTRKELEKEDKFMVRFTLHSIAECMIEMFKADEISLEELDHVKVLMKYLYWDKELLEEHGELLGMICNKLYKSGKYTDVFRFSIGAGQFVNLTLGQNHRWVLQMTLWKAIAMKKSGLYEESLENLKKVYEKQKSNFGEDDPDCLKAAEEIGSVYLELKNFDEAMKMNVYVLEKREKLHGNEHLFTLAIKNNIAAVLHEQQKWNEAIELYEEILDVQERKLGKEHPSTLTTKHNIAAAKFDRKEFPEALKEFKRVLELREKVLESNHPDTLATKFLMAKTYYHLNKYEDSLQLANEVYENRFQALKPRHPDTTAAEIFIKMLKKKD